MCENQLCVPGDANGSGSGSGAELTCPNELLFQRGTLFKEGQVIRLTLDDLVEHPLDTGDPADITGRYAPDGNRVALIRGASAVVIVDLDGNNAHQVDSQAGAIDDLAWSPDGNSLAYGVVPFTGDTTERIYVASVNGTSGSSITPTGQAQLPSWSPDGTKILFSSNRTGDYDVFTMKPDGSGITNLTGRPHDDGKDGAHWSPDGSKIVFTGFNSVWTMNSDGTGGVQATDAGNGIATWGSDGKIYYVHSPDPGEIMVTNPNGTNQTPVISDDFINTDPVLSPDAKKLAFAKRDNGTRFRLYVSNADGSQPTRVTNADADDRYPMWRPCH